MCAVDGLHRALKPFNADVLVMVAILAIVQEFSPVFSAQEFAPVFSAALVNVYYVIFCINTKMIVQFKI
jgi:hypothetical protein